MNKIYFGKFKAPLFVGAMLLGVASCSNYDDEIDALNDRIDSMETTINSIPEQLEQIQNSIPDISSLTSDIASLQSELLKYEDVLDDIASLESAVASLEEMESRLEDYVDGATSKESLTATLDQVYATIDDLEDVDVVLETLSDAIEALQGKDGEIDTEIDALQTTLESIQDTIESLQDDAANWIGKGEIADIITAYGYATEDYVKELNDKTNETLLAEIAKIEEEQAAYRESVAEEFSKYDEQLAAITEQFATINVDFTELNEKCATLQSSVDALTARIAELENRIQSLVYIPNALIDAYVNFNAKSYITFDGGEKVYLDSKVDYQELSYRVSPASVLDKITAENYADYLSIVSDQTSRSSEELFSVVGFEKSETESGKFTIKVKSNIDNETGNYIGYVIALNVVIPSSDASIQGIDFISTYASAAVWSSEDISSSLCYANSDQSSYSSTTYGRWESRQIQYNDEAEYKFFDGYELYIYDGSYTLYSDIYATEISVEVVEPKDAATVTANEASYKLTAISAQIIEPAPALIGNVIESKEYNFNVKIGDNSLALMKNISKIYVETAITEATTEAVDVVWKYSNWGWYSQDNIVVKSGDLTADQYNDARFSWSTVSVYDAEGNDVAINAYVELTNDPTIDTDVMYAKVVLNHDNDLATGSYVVVAKYTLPDLSVVELSIPINYTALPEIAPAVINVPAFGFDGTTQFTLVEDYADLVWNAAWEGLFFTDKAEFVAAIYGGSVNNTTAATSIAQPSVSGQDILVSFSNVTLDSFGAANAVSFEVVAPFATIEFSSSVVLENSLADDLQRVNAYFNGDIVTVITKLSGDSFDVEDFELTNIYSSKSKNIAVTYLYTVVEDLTSFVGTQPDVVSGCLKWNDWNEFELDVKVQLMISGIVVAEDTFVAKINDPIADAISVDTTKLSLTASVGANLYISDALTLKETLGDTNVFNATGLVADTATALAATATYTFKSTNDESFMQYVEESDGHISLTIDATSAVFVTPVTMTYTVKYSYLYGEREKEVVVTINPAAL